MTHPSILFSLYVSTQWGENISIVLSSEEKSLTIPLHCIHDGKWQVEVSALLVRSYKTYRYIIASEHYSRPHKESICYDILPLPTDSNSTITNYWSDMDTPNYIHSSAFRNIFFARHITPMDLQKGKISFVISSLFLSPHYSVVLCGNHPTLGNWSIENAPHLRCSAYGTWSITLNSDTLPNETEYKYVILNTQTGYAKWQEGKNLYFEKNNSVDIQVENIQAHQYHFRAAGVAIPIFSIRTQSDAGIGDFLSLKNLVDWADAMQLKVIQTLPIYDTTNSYTWRDSYPYSAISVYALHPIYLGISHLPIKDSKAKQHFSKQIRELNGYDSVDYEKVLQLKKAYSTQLFKENFDTVSTETAYRSFVEENKFWLFPYACFSILRDMYGTANFSEWPSEFRQFKNSTIKEWMKHNPQTIQLVNEIYYIQYLLHQQLQEATQYARSKGIILKGDIPIGVNKYSVETWTEPHLFNLDKQAGAPPDDFAILGQNWGFPTYNWQQMSQNNYLWWQQRLKKMADYFDAYRIDHILGFFRIWEIPQHALHALLGYFSPALPLSQTEIEDKWQLAFDNSFTTPQLTKEQVYELFGKYAEDAIAHFLQENTHQYWQLQPHVDTQRKIVSFFSKLPENSDNASIKESLLRFAEEVLFIPDGEQSHLFHPRIALQNTLRFKALSHSQQWAINELYEHFFFHRHNHFWQQEALKKLPSITQATSMLPCGEDLGMIPSCVAPTMKELQILQLDIERMPKNPRLVFEEIEELPLLSVCASSTHDMAPIRLWWEQNPVLIQTYWNTILNQPACAPEQAPPEACLSIIKRHLHSPAMFTILPIQDWLSACRTWREYPPEKEQINNPANPEHYWQYRMQMSIEELMDNSNEWSDLPQMVIESMRS